MILDDMGALRDVSHTFLFLLSILSNPPFVSSFRTQVQSET